MRSWKTQSARCSTPIARCCSMPRLSGKLSQPRPDLVAREARRSRAASAKRRILPIAASAGIAARRCLISVPPARPRSPPASDSAAVAARTCRILAVGKIKSWKTSCSKPSSSSGTHRFDQAATLLRTVAVVEDARFRRFAAEAMRRLNQYAEQRHRWREKSISGWKRLGSTLPNTRTSRPSRHWMRSPNHFALRKFARRSRRRAPEERVAPTRERDSRCDRPQSQV